MASLAAWSLAALLPIAAIAQETITLRDGTTYDGRMTGATERSITFRDNSGQMHRFDVDRVERIQFAGPSRENSHGGEYPGNNSYPPAPPPAQGYQGNTYPNPAYPNPAYPPPGANQNPAARPAYSPGSAPGYSPGYSMTLPAGTAIAVRTNERIDTRDASQGTSYSAQVDRDITSPDGNVLIPRGSEARLVVRRVNDNSLTLDLESVRVNGRIFRVDTSSPNPGGREGLGENKRTGEFVGGGAVLGTLLGAIAGGGKGAAIGALAGAGAGAGAQVLTRGDQVKVPAESVLSFRLERPLHLNAA
ncbi:MAG TPA: hypothetical protein VG345_02080 [Bryobacteraceae bacterium]|jgi:hypothetical protein|nr:hypothetical protein [Bryobacteraceae bacterium]